MKNKGPYRAAIAFYVSVWRWLCRIDLLVVFAFLAGIGALALYQNIRPDTIVVENRYICTFKTPDGWVWPEKS